MLEEEGGYRTEVWRLNAAAFGVPQDRIRCFLVASRLPLMPARPAAGVPGHPPAGPRPRRAAAGDARRGHLRPARRARPGPGVAVEGVDRRRPGDRPAVPPLPRQVRHPAAVAVLLQHTVRYHNPRDLELYALLRPGEDSIHVLEQHGRADLMRYRRDVFDDKYARLRGDRPCKTIVAHLAKDGNGYIHPTQVRSISFREAARVQSFHDGYVFCGSPSDQWVQLGNAVPPVLAEAIARSFRRTLERS